MQTSRDELMTELQAIIQKNCTCTSTMQCDLHTRPFTEQQINDLLFQRSVALTRIREEVGSLSWSRDYYRLHTQGV